MFQTGLALYGPQLQDGERFSVNIKGWIKYLPWGGGNIGVWIKGNNDLLQSAWKEIHRINEITFWEGEQFYSIEKRRLIIHYSSIGHCLSCCHTSQFISLSIK